MKSLHPDDAMVLNWLALLDREAQLEEFVAQRQAAIDHGAGAAEADTAFHLALGLRDKINESRLRSRELAALNLVATSISSAKELPTLLREIVAQARILVRVDLAYLVLLEEAGARVEVTAGEISRTLAGLLLPPGQGLFGALVRTRAPYATKDYQADPAFAHAAAADQSAVAEDIRGLLGVPMLLNDEVIGAVFVGKREQRTFAPAEISLVTSLAAHAAVVIDRSRTDAHQREASLKLRNANEALADERARLESLVAWSARITKLLLAGHGTRGLLNEASTALSLGLFLLEPNEDMPDLPDALPPSLFEQGHSEPVENQLHRGQDHWYLVRPIYSDHTMAHLICVSSELPDAHVQLLVDQTASGLALSLLGQRIADQATAWLSGSALLALLTQESIDHDLAVQHVGAAGLSLSQPYCVAAVHLPPRDDRERPTRAQPALSGLPPGSATARFGDRFVAVAPRTGIEELGNRLLHLLGPNCTVGLSGPAVGLSALRKAFRDANQTLDVLFSLGRRGVAETSTGLGVYRLLLSSRGIVDANDYYWRTLGALHEAQERHGVPLVETVSEFLTHNQRHAPAARALNIHPNTLYQRLDTVSRVLGADWRTPRRTLEIQLLLNLNTVGLLANTSISNRPHDASDGK